MGAVVIMKVKIQMLELEVEGEGVAEVVAAALGKFLAESTTREVTPNNAGVDCPRCGVSAGRLCKADGGGYYHDRVHAERAAAALTLPTDQKGQFPVMSNEAEAKARRAIRIGNILGKVKPKTWAHLQQSVTLEEVLIMGEVLAVTDLVDAEHEGHRSAVARWPNRKGGSEFVDDTVAAAQAVRDAAAADADDDEKAGHR